MSGPPSWGASIGVGVGAVLGAYALALLFAGIALAAAVALTEPMDDDDLEGFGVFLLGAAVLAPLWLAATVAAFVRLARLAGVALSWRVALAAALVACGLVAAAAWVYGLVDGREELLLGLVVTAPHLLVVAGLASLVRRATESP